MSLPPVRIPAAPLRDPAHLQQLRELVQFASDPRNLDTLRQQGSSIGALLRTYDPEVQRVAMGFLNAYDYANTYGRDLPFQERLAPESVTEHFDVPDSVARQVYQHAVDDQLTAELQRRMGTDAELPPPEPTLRDHVEAALDAYTSQES